MDGNQTPGQGQPQTPPPAGNPENVAPQLDIIFRGMPVTLKPLTYRSRGMVAHWLRQRALRAVLENPQEYGASIQEALAMVHRDWAALVFSYGEPLFWKAVFANDPRFRIQLVWLSIRQTDPEFPDPDADNAAWKLWQNHEQEIWPFMVECLNRPNFDGPLAEETPAAAA